METAPKEPKNYSKYSGIYEAVCSGGLGKFVEPTGLELHRLITGVPTENVKAFFDSQNPGRNSFPGFACLYCTDKLSLTSAETPGNLGFHDVPANSHILGFDFYGNALRIDKIDNPIFESGYLNMNSGEKWEFSQGFRFCLEQNNLADGIDAIVWPSVSGKALRESGHVYGCLPPYSGALKYKGFETLT